MLEEVTHAFKVQQNDGYDARTNPYYTRVAKLIKINYI